MTSPTHRGRDTPCPPGWLGGVHRFGVHGLCPPKCWVGIRDGLSPLLMFVCPPWECGDPGCCGAVTGDGGTGGFLLWGKGS